MSTPTFSPQDAEFLITHAQTAPLANLKHAENVSALLIRFKAWYEHVSAKPAPTSRKARQENPAGQSQDPAS